jgi:hypothetical protein
MLDQHSQVSIAQIVFYVPAVIAAVTLLFFRRAVKGLPRYAWYVLTLFTLSKYFLYHTRKILLIKSLSASGWWNCRNSPCEQPV